MKTTLKPFSSVLPPICKDQIGLKIENWQFSVMNSRQRLKKYSFFQKVRFSFLVSQEKLATYSLTLQCIFCEL